MLIQRSQKRLGENHCSKRGIQHMGTHTACQFRYSAENADSSLKDCHPIIPSGRAFTEGICRHMVGSLTSVTAGCLQRLFYAYYASKETVGHGTVSFQELVVHMTFNHCSLTQKCLLQLYNFFQVNFRNKMDLSYCQWHGR